MEEIQILIISVFTVMILTLYLFIHTTKVMDKILLGLSVIGQMITLIGSFFRNKNITEIGHVIFGVILFIVPIFGQSNYILILVSLVILLTLITRKLCNNCIFHYDKGRKKIFNFIPNFNWDLTYSFLLGVAIVRLLKL